MCWALHLSNLTMVPSPLPFKTFPLRNTPVSASQRSIWAGRQQYLPQLGKKYDFPSRQRRKRMEAGGRGLGGGTATHSHMRGLILQLLPLPGSPPALPPFYPLSLSGVPIRSRGQAGFAAGHQQETQQRHTLGPCSHPAVLL